MSNKLIRRVLLRGFPGFRLTILCLFWSVMSALTALLFSFLVLFYLTPAEGEPYILQKKVAALPFLGGDNGFTDSEIAGLKAWPEIEKVGVLQTARVPLFLQLDLKGSTWGSSLFLESVSDDWLGDGIRWPEDPNSIPLILGKDFLDLYNWGFAPTQGLPKLSMAEAALIPLRLTAGKAGTELQTYPARIWTSSDRFQTFLIPPSWMDRLSGTVKPACLRVLCQVKPGAFTPFKEKISVRGWELTSSGASNPWRGVSELLLMIFLGIALVFALLMAGWALLFIQLWWSRLRDRLISLLELCMDPDALKTNLRNPFFKILGLTAIPEIIVILISGFYVKSGGAQSLTFVGIAGLIFLIFLFGFAFLYTRSLGKTLRNILQSLS